MAVPTGTVCLTDLRTEFGDANGGNVCLTEYYAGGANVNSGTTNGSGTAIPSSGTLCLKSNFAGAQSEISTVSNVSNATSGEFVDNVFYSGGFGAGGISWQLVQESSASGSNYVSKFYLERTSSAYFGTVGSTNMSVGILYPLQTTTFTQANWPDSYYIDINTSVSATGGGQETFYEVAGSGEDFTSSANWDSAVKTLLDPGYQGNSTPSTAFGATALTTGECASYTAIWTSTINFYYKKSGYPDLLAGTKTVYTEINMVYSGICP